MRAPVFIDDPADPRIAPYRDVRERDLVGRQGLFIAEGQVVLHNLSRSRDCEALSLLIADKRIAALAPLIAQFPEDTPLYAAGQGVLDAVVGFHLHRGVLALGRRRHEPSADSLLAGCGPRALAVCLMGIGNHDNMGGIFRNAAAFGADAVILDQGCCDPLYRKAIRVAVGASLITPFARLEPGADPAALLAAHGFETVSLSPKGAIPLERLPRPPRVAAVFGAEGPGLPAAILARTTTAAVTMSAGFDSLNVATTSGIVLHHLATAKGGEPPGVEIAEV